MFCVDNIYRDVKIETLNTDLIKSKYNHVQGMGRGGRMEVSEIGSSPTMLWSQFIMSNDKQ